MRRVLIVDDNLLNRQVLANILHDEYSVVEADGGASALAILEREYEHISAVLLDLLMPEVDGYAVLLAMRQDAKLRQIPVIVATASTEDSTEIKALSLGANDFITKPYKPAVIKSRLANMISLRETAAIANAAERDALTGLYNREAFFRKAADMIASRDAGYYVLACLDIDNFKVINDQYGSAMGDTVLRHVADTLKRGFSAVDGISCRISADNFAALYPASFVNSRALDNIRQTAATAGGWIPPVTLSTGRYIVSDLTLPVSAMYDRAIIAEMSVKGRFDVHVALYDESMRARILREQEIVNDMYQALVDRQFEVWFQPQFNHSSGAIIGAEALVRWRHPQRGLIPPGEFIPVFERNGFIYELDRYVWEECCACLRRWIDRGDTPLPLSVNVSRYDLFQESFFTSVTDLVAKYRLPVELVKLEITESAFANSAEHIISEVKRLTEHGFTVEIDDFGSGYSSLNTLKDVPASVLKLDMRFLEGEDNTERGGNILESIIRMAKWLGMPVIAEGVETKAQADYLRSVGCLYVQGYLYARPMPTSDYEKLVSGADKEKSLIVLENVDTLDNDAFWNPNSMETLIFNSYVGGSCIFEFYQDKVEILRINRKFAKELGRDGMSMEDVTRTPLEKYMTSSDQLAILDAIQQAVRTGEESACEARIFYPDFSASPTYFSTSLRVLARAGDRTLVYATVFNVTAQREAERRVREASEQLQAIMDNVNGGITATVIDGEAPRLLFSNDQYYAQLGYTREQFRLEVTNPFMLIHPDDRERVVSQTLRGSAEQKPFTCIFRAVRRDESIVWLQSNISITSLPNVSGVVQLAVANDITAQVTAQRRERETAAQLSAFLKHVGGGVSATTIVGGEVRYLFVNDQYYSMYGYTREQFQAELPRGLFDLVHPDDLAAVIDSAKQSETSAAPVQIEYRAVKRDGSLIWVRGDSSVCSLEGVREPVHLTVSIDVSKEKETEKRILESAEQLRFLNDTAHDLMARSDTDSGMDSVLGKTLDYFGGARAFVCEYDYEAGVSLNTYEVVAQGEASCREAYDDMRIDTQWYWLDTFRQSDFLHIDDTEALGMSREDEREFYRSQGVTSVLAVSLRMGDRVIGTMGVHNPTRHLEDYDNLAALGDFAAVMLVRRDMLAKIRADNLTLQSLMNDTPGGFARMKLSQDGALTVEYVNEGLCRIMGCTKDMLPHIVGSNAMDCVHPEDRDQVTAALGEALSGDNQMTIKYRIKRVDGTYRWVMVLGRMTLDEAGEKHCNIYYTDLSEQHGLEMSYQQMLPVALETMMEASTDFSFVKDRSLTYIACSRSLADLMGLKSAKDIVGKTDYDLYDKARAKSYRAEDRAIIKSGKSVVDRLDHLPSEDGRSHYSRVSKYPMHDSSGNVIGLYGSARDVTENMQNYAQLKLLIDSIPGGLVSFIINPDGAHPVYLSDGVYDVVGYDKAGVNALSSTNAINMLYEEDRPAARRQIEELYLHNVPIDDTYRIHTKLGETRWVILRGVPMERRDDMLVFNAVIFDVTKQIKAEEAARLAQEQIAKSKGNSDC